MNRNWTRWAPNTQLTPSYCCHVTGERIQGEDGLAFIIPANEDVDIYCPGELLKQLCSVNRCVLKRIPAKDRSKKMSEGDRCRFNVHASDAKFERGGSIGSAFDHDRHLIGNNDDIGKFLFSISEAKLRKYLPKAFRFLRSRYRKQAFDYHNC